MARKEPQLKWEDMGLSFELVRGIYYYGLSTPSDISIRTIMTINQGHDVFIHKGRPMTGSSISTFISALQRLDSSNPQCQIIVLTHTRELSFALHRIIRSLGEYMEPFDCHALGNTNESAARITNGCQIVVGTPGQTLDMISRGVLKVDGVKMLILDEMEDIMMLGLDDYVHSICQLLPRKKQSVIVAVRATKEVVKLVNSIANDPIRIS